MKKFLVLYMIPVGALDDMMKNSTPAEREKGMADWKAWMDSNASSISDMGAPTGKNTRVTRDSASDVRNEVCGYSVVTADSHEAAAELLKTSPHIQMPGAYIEVLELMSMEGA